MQGPYLPRSEMEEPGDHERDINDLLNSAGVPKSRPRTHRNQAEQQEISSDLPLPIPPTPLNHPRSPTPVHGKTVFQEISPRCQKRLGATEIGDLTHPKQKDRGATPHNGRQQAKHRNKLRYAEENNAAICSGK